MQPKVRPLYYGHRSAGESSITAYFLGHFDTFYHGTRALLDSFGRFCSSRRFSEGHAGPNPRRERRFCVVSGNSTNVAFPRGFRGFREVARGRRAHGNSPTFLSALLPSEFRHFLGGSPRQQLMRILASVGLGEKGGEIGSFAEKCPPRASCFPALAGVPAPQARSATVGTLPESSPSAPGAFP